MYTIHKFPIKVADGYMQLNTVRRVVKWLYVKANDETFEVFVYAIVDMDEQQKELQRCVMLFTGEPFLPEDDMEYLDSFTLNSLVYHLFVEKL